MKAIITNFSGLTAIAYDSTGRNRSLDHKWVMNNVDPTGNHLCTFKMDHNDKELRTMWTISVKPETKGATKFGESAFGLENVFIDMSYDAFDKLCQTIDTDNLVPPPHLR